MSRPPDNERLFHHTPSVSDPVSVLLVDDHALVRRGFRRLLEDDPGIVVVGEASDGETAVQMAATLKPRVVVMDCAMPGTSGLAAMSRILELMPDVAILMLSVHSEEPLVRQALEAGARGYVLKEAMDLNLAQAVHQVATGETVLDPKVSRTAILRTARVDTLSARQLEVLQLVCDGLSSQAIAARLGLSIHTVAAHRANMLKVLGLRRTADLVAHAMRHRLVRSQ